MVAIVKKIGILSAASLISSACVLGANYERPELPAPAAFRFDSPAQAQSLIASSADLYRRVARLDSAQLEVGAPASPARSMLDRLAHAF